MERQTLNVFAASRLAELRSKGLEPTLDEIIWLHETGKQMSDPPGLGTVLMDMPIQCGNVTLHRLSIGALCWWTEYGAKWFKAGHPLECYLLAFVSAHAHAPEVFRACTDYDRTEKHIRAWMDTLTCTSPQLEAAVAQALKPPQDQPPVDNNTPMAWTDLVADLQAAYGETFAAWVWERSIELAVAYSRRLANREGRACTSNDPLTLATWNQQQAFNAIVKAHTEAHNG
jgi:hypothetical protein